jgi:hypothetical protein
MLGYLGHALGFARRGLHVFPCKPRGKEPATRHGCKDATTDPAIIEQWWRGNPDCNIAVATGTLSKVFCVDIDGIDAESELRKLEAQYGALPPTVESITARGRHLFFKMPPQPLRNSTGKVATGIDVRADGGYVIVPPSKHPSGRDYYWSVDTSNTFAPAPDWLLARISDPRGNSTIVATPPSEWRELVKGVAEGARDCSAAKLTGYLLRHRVDPYVALELVQVWNAARCTPPLPEEDIERIVDSISARELRRRGGL